MLLATQKKPDLQLSAEEFRALGSSGAKPMLSSDCIERCRAFVANWQKFRRKANSQSLSAKRLEAWLDKGSKRKPTLKREQIEAIHWEQTSYGKTSLELFRNFIAGKDLQQLPQPDEITYKVRALPSSDNLPKLPSQPNQNRKAEVKYVRYLYHTDKASRKVRVAVRENGIPIKIRETEREILRRRAELTEVLPFFERAKEERAKKRRGEEYDERLASLCERLPPSPRISREPREGDIVSREVDEDLPPQAQRFLRLLATKLGAEQGYLVFDCLRCGCSVRQSADGICAESSLRSWIAAAK